MSLNPGIAAFLAALGARPPFHRMTVQELRALPAFAPDLPGKDARIAGVDDAEMDEPAGSIPVRIYTPIGAGRFPALVFFHGGGWTLGNVGSSDSLCRALCAGAGCVVISVGYRLAPEHKFPAAFQDGCAAVLWATRCAVQLGIDPARIAVGGESAGGNLAAAVAIQLRDSGGPQLCGQLLFYPVTEYPDRRRASLVEHADAPMLCAADLSFFWDLYLSDPRIARNDPRAAPSVAMDHSRLPSTFIATAQIDPLRDDGAAYAEKLRAAGVPVTYRCYDGTPHGFCFWVGLVEAVDAAVAEAVSWLRSQFSVGGRN